MALKLIAVQGMTVTVDQTTVNPPVTPLVATIIVSPPTGSKAKAGGAIAHVDGDQITVTAIAVPSAGATTPDPGPHVVAVNSTASKTKAEGTLVLLEGDQSVTINATPQIPGSPPTNYPVTFKCIISAAGQTKAKGS